MTSARWLFLSLAISLFASNPAISADNSPSFKLISEEPTLSPRSVTGPATFVLLLEGVQLPADGGEPSDFTDSLSQIAFTPAGTDPGKAKRHWRITAKFLNNERPAEGTRYITFRYGGTGFALSYKLAETKLSALDWNVSPLLSEAALGPGERFHIWIATKDMGATGVRLARQSIHSDPDQTPLAGQWSLCDGPGKDATCVEMNPNAAPTPFSVAANSAKDFWIELPNGQFVGKYTGSFWIAADQSNAGTALAVTIFESSTCHKIIGFSILTGSVVAAWFFGVFLRAKANRLQLERPFAILRSQQAALVAQYNALNPRLRDAAATFGDQLGELGENLKTTNLSAVLGTGSPVAYGAPPQVSNGYKEKLDALSNKTALLKRLMEDGLRIVNRMADKLNAPRAAHDIANLSTAVAVTDSTAKSIADALAQLDEHLDAQFVAHLANRATILFREPSVQSIDLSLQSINIFAWGLLGVGSIVIGLLLLILNHPGFGTVYDYILCAAWGFGLPVGATGLASATTTTVATAFKIGT